MKVQLILGNQLFDSAYLKGRLEPGSWIFMREDVELCTHFRYHKQKLLLFLSAMRKFAIEAEQAGFLVHYEKLNLSIPTVSFEESLENI